MKHFRENIWKEGEYTYAASYGFVPNIRAYLHDDTDVGGRDAMIVLPGGGYCLCAPHEGQEVALEFYEKGMNAFVLTYSTDITMSVPLKKQPLNDVSRAVRFIRSRQEEYGIKGGKVILCGFSAASHVCGSLAVHFKDVDDPLYKDVSNKPDGVILSYPVISSGKYSHGSSFEALLGKDASAEELEYFSLEKQVTEDTPPCFLWQTKTDELVPVMNSYLFAGALEDKGVPYAHYVYPFGPHGMGLTKEPVALNEPVPDAAYALEQLDLAIEAVRAGKGVNVSETRRKELEEQFPDGIIPSKMYGTKNPHDLSEVSKDVGTWPALAKVWIDRL